MGPIAPISEAAAAGKALEQAVSLSMTEELQAAIRRSQRRSPCRVSSQPIHFTAEAAAILRRAEQRSVNR